MRQASLQPKTSGTLLHIEDLHTYFFTRERTIRALDGVDMRLARSVTAGIVGESGCGKTMLALSVMRLVPSPGKIVSGHIWFEDKDLLELDEESMRNIRGGKISMI
ncbi:MAG TPA: ATP-binding cassette domain-containing protein, partial [Deltaproteobacteria bacterium]|nr:ATP-binding cassette domain-containing protein [Deltaproteobacteria bacterium]